MRVSVVIPAYNEADTLPLLRGRMTAVMDALHAYDFELVLVDDHSADATPERIAEWAALDGRVRGVRFARNCGSHAAAAAGLARCTGDCAVLMAADLQDPPELLAELLAPWRDGYDVVWAARAGRRGIGWRERLCSRAYWALMRFIAASDAPAEGADVVLLDRKVIDALNAIGEKHTSLLALVTWLGFRQKHISYVKEARAAGASGWTFTKRLKLAIDSVVSFSALPIRLTWLCGLLFLAADALWITAVLGGWLTGLWYVSAAIAAIISLLLLGFGVLLTFLGAAGEYLWRAYDEVRGRPRYVIERVLEPADSRFVAERAARPAPTRVPVPDEVETPA
ncbi:MAG: glycosyltransferase family 2 protein [Phycisphaerae bacterium]|nr:glycosyltransferase family 2 protein [Phycisphaerae bacterium]